MKMQLELHVFIRTVDERGYPQGGGLEIRETAIIDTHSFLETAKILGQFHDLTESFKLGMGLGREKRT